MLSRDSHDGPRGRFRAEERMARPVLPNMTRLSSSVKKKPSGHGFWILGGGIQGRPLPPCESRVEADTGGLRPLAALVVPARHQVRASEDTCRRIMAGAASSTAGW